MAATRVEPATSVCARRSDGEALPTIPAARLIAMMDVAYGLRQFGRLPKAANADAVAAVFEGAAENLAEVAADRIRRGLFRRHVEKPEDLRFIPDEPARGSWLDALFAQDPYLRCRYDGSIADFEDNEVLLWSLFAAVGAALRSPALADNAQQQSRMLAGSMPLNEVNANAGIARVYGRLSTHGRPLHGLCRLLLEHAGLRFGDDDGRSADQHRSSAHRRSRGRSGAAGRRRAAHNHPGPSVHVVVDGRLDRVTNRRCHGARHRFRPEPGSIRSAAGPIQANRTAPGRLADRAAADTRGRPRCPCSRC
ncbi:MAG: hypothetical protein MJE12_12355 [Alphaproteobacteria bacterium]|nr:hypothetical protein [Alphaproteobacteria bacterium]